MAATERSSEYFATHLSQTSPSARRHPDGGRCGGFCRPFCWRWHFTSRAQRLAGRRVPDSILCRRNFSATFAAALSRILRPTPCSNLSCIVNSAANVGAAESYPNYSVVFSDEISFHRVHRVWLEALSCLN